MLLKIDTMKYYQIHFGNSEASLRCKRDIIKNYNNMVLKIYNQETIEAMIEAERIALDPSAKSYTVDEAFEELEKD